MYQDQAKNNTKTGVALALPEAVSKTQLKTRNLLT
jgi:hypothetical protein